MNPTDNPRPHVVGGSIPPSGGTAGCGHPALRGLHKAAWRGGGMWASHPTGATVRPMEAEMYGTTERIRSVFSKPDARKPVHSCRTGFRAFSKPVYGKVAKNLCPLNLWGQRFVDLHREALCQRRLAAIQFSGSFTVKRQPRPGRFSCAISPPQTFRMRLTSARPRPLPSSRWELSP